MISISFHLMTFFCSKNSISTIFSYKIWSIRRSQWYKDTARKKIHTQWATLKKYNSYVESCVLTKQLMCLNINLSWEGTETGLWAEEETINDGIPPFPVLVTRQVEMFITINLHIMWWLISKLLIWNSLKYQLGKKTRKTTTSHQIYPVALWNYPNGAKF